jgi:hypothetical protein
MDNDRASAADVLAEGRRGCAGVAGSQARRAYPSRFALSFLIGAGVASIAPYAKLI